MLVRMDREEACFTRCLRAFTEVPYFDFSGSPSGPGQADLS